MAGSRCMGLWPNWRDAAARITHARVQVEIWTVTFAGVAESWWRTRACTVALPAGLLSAAVAWTTALDAFAVTRADDGTTR